MPRLTIRFTTFAVAFLTSFAMISDRAKAQSYPIDCAILLCLSGGWPTSEPCTRARAEFIRRITPWPVEPPLQIWLCPMAAAQRHGIDPSDTYHLQEILFQMTDTSVPRLFFVDPITPRLMPSVSSERRTEMPSISQRLAPKLVQDRADIDISGPEFNFVRSIQVFDVRYARQRESGRDGDCNRSAIVVHGTYGTQGDFTWSGSSTGALPEAHSGLERWGEHCPNIFHRSVFVEWRDHEGDYGFEQVNY